MENTTHHVWYWVFSITLTDKPSNKGMYTKKFCKCVYYNFECFVYLTGIYQMIEMCI